MSVSHSPPPASARIKAVFLDALDKAPCADRVAYLDESCAGDTAVRQHVEALLEAHDRPDRLLDCPASEHFCGEPDDAIGPDDSLDFLAPSQKPGSLGRLGHYEVLELCRPRRYGNGVPGVR